MNRADLAQNIFQFKCLRYFNIFLLFIARYNIKAFNILSAFELTNRSHVFIKLVSLSTFKNVFYRTELIHLANCFQNKLQYLRNKICIRI